MNLNLIKLDTLATDIFSDVAKQTAEYLSQAGEKNKSTQLRRFYDELVMWHDKVFRAVNRNETYQQVAPFVQMLKAKAEYSYGRKNVDQNFVKVFNRIIGQIQSPDTLKNAKLFFEAVLGYRKAKELENQQRN